MVTDLGEPEMPHREHSSWWEEADDDDGTEEDHRTLPSCLEEN